MDEMTKNMTEEEARKFRQRIAEVQRKMRADYHRAILKRWDKRIAIAWLYVVAAVIGFLLGRLTAF